MQWIRVEDSRAGSVFLPLYNDDFGTLFEPADVQSRALGVASSVQTSSEADSNEHSGKSGPKKTNAQHGASLKPSSPSAAARLNREPRIMEKRESTISLESNQRQPTVERRIDASDGGAYTFAEFEAFYGVDAAKTLWNMAQRLPEFIEKDSKGGHTGDGRAPGATAEGGNQHPEGGKKRRRRRR